MEQVTPEVVDAAQGLWAQLRVFFQTMLLPWRLYQIAAILALVLLAWLAARIASPRLTGWLRRREGWPKWRLRLGLQIHRRLRLIFFALLAWITVAILRPRVATLI